MRKELLLLLNLFTLYSTALFSLCPQFDSVICLPDTNNWTVRIIIDRKCDTISIMDVTHKTYMRHLNAQFPLGEYEYEYQFKRRCPQYTETDIEAPGDTTRYTVSNWFMTGHYHHESPWELEDGEMDESAKVGWWHEGYDPPSGLRWRYYFKHLLNEDGIDLNRVIIPSVIFFLFLLLSLFVFIKLKKFGLFFYINCGIWFALLVLRLYAFISIEGRVKQSVTKNDLDFMVLAFCLLAITNLFQLVLSLRNLYSDQKTTAVKAWSIVFVILCSITLLIELAVMNYA